MRDWHIKVLILVSHYMNNHKSLVRDDSPELVVGGITLYITTSSQIDSFRLWLENWVQLCVDKILVQKIEPTEVTVER